MRKLFFFSFSALLILIPTPVFAHGTNYIEFNPDYFKTKSLNVSAGGTLYELLLPANEFFSGVDFWFDNAGNSGTALFELYNQNNNLIMTKSVTVPHIDPIAGGQRVHVDWNSQLAVVGSNLYKIKISSSLPQLQIYYSDRIGFLGHNEPHVSDYFNGAAEINGEEKEFSFKYALYETSESSLPIISNLVWTVVSPQQMRLDFNANESVDYKVEYSPSGQGIQNTNFTGEYQFCIEGVATCNLIISVAPNTAYQYLLTAKDLWGNRGQSSGIFTSWQTQTNTSTPTTTSAPTLTPTSTESPTGSPVPIGTTPIPSLDVTLPIISNLKIATLTDKSVDIAWTTNEAANSHLLISFTTELITITDAFDGTFELEHLLKVGSVLNPSTPYLATITSRDMANNEARASMSFTTLAFIPPPPQPPSATNQPAIIPPSVTGGGGPTGGQSSQGLTISNSSSNSGSNITTIEWEVPAAGEPSQGYRIDIFDKNGNLKRSIEVSGSSRSIEASGLEDEEYYTVVYAVRDGVFEKITPSQNFQVDRRSVAEKLLTFATDYLVYLIITLIGLAIIAWKIFSKRKSAPVKVVP